MFGAETVAVIGGGGRESAIAHAYVQSPHVKGVLAIPGNDLMKHLHTGTARVETFQHLTTTSVKEIVALCAERRVGLVDVAQDNAVEAGLVDALRAKGMRAVGPTREAGQLEWDKGDARKRMERYGVPHPSFHVCHSVEDGIDYLRGQPDRAWVVKANGLAEGKGVIICSNSNDAIDAVRMMPRFKAAGETFVIEEFVTGEEFSMFALSDGDNYKVLGSAQDHKLAGNFDTGENTGGMGCSTPPLVLTDEVMQDVRTNILDKTIQGMRADGRPYTGVLYVGGMVEKDSGEVTTIEFNSRWGDPEAQAIVPGIDSDYFELMHAAASGSIRDLQLHTNNYARVVVAGASRGYPGDYSAVKGKEVFGIDDAAQTENVTLYGAGVTRDEETGRNYAKGGRLLYAVGRGKDVIMARARAYAAMAKIYVDGNNLHFRNDIGWRDVERLRKES